MLHHSAPSVRALSFNAASISTIDPTGPAILADFASDLGPGSSHHTVYNFEVAEHHTYIANDIRVHNTSVLDFLKPEELKNIKDIELTDDGKRVKAVTVDIDNGNVEYEVYTRVNGNTTSVVREMTTYDKNGNLYYKRFIEGENGKVVVKNVSLDGQQLGEDVGKALTPFFSQAFVGKNDSYFKKIAVDTVMDTVLGNLGEIMGGFVHRAGVDYGSFSIMENLEDITDAAMLDLGADLTIAGLNSTISVVNELIVAELFKNADLDGIDGAVLKGVTSFGINKLLRDGAGQLVNSKAFINILDDLKFSADRIDQIQEAFAPGSVKNLNLSAANMVFSTIFNEIVPPIETLEGQAASVITNALVNFLKIAGEFAGPIGVVFGWVIGKFFDALFGDDPEPRAFAKIGFDAETGHFKILSSYSKDGGDEGLARKMAEAYVMGINGFIDTVQSNSNNYDEIGQWSIGHFMSSLKNAGKNGKTFANFQDLYINSYVNTVADARHNDGQMAAVRALNQMKLEEAVASSNSIWSYILQGADQTNEVPKYSLYRDAVKKVYDGEKMRFDYLMKNETNYIQRGGISHLEILKVLSNYLNDPGNTSRIEFKELLKERYSKEVYTQEEIFKEIGMALSVADDYHRYLENQKEINTQIAMNPDSAFAAGWMTTLMQAKEMGLDKAYKLTGDAISNNFFTADGHDSVSGMAGNDDIRTYGGNDTLNGGAGADRMKGGSGNDVYYVDNAGDKVIEHARSGTDLVYSSISFDLGETIHIENATLTGTANIKLHGNKLGNTLTGNSGNNHIDGRLGHDDLRGGAGNDTLVGGDSGNDMLNGGAGSDRMVGGVGDDIYFIDNGGDVVVEGANGGADRINSSIGIDLNRAGGVYANVENVFLTGTALNVFGSSIGNFLVGNTENNRLDGREGNDTLYGGAGADSLNGGTGTDTATYSSTASRVVVDLANVSANVGDAKGDTYTGIENVTGSRFHDTINGDTGANTLHGSDGNDSLNGRAGADIMTGGAGSDTFVFAKNHDADRVSDFQNNVDQIRLLNLGVTSFAEAKTYATQSGTNVIFNFGNGDTLRIDNTTINALADDMIFV